jgi:hypothetical protein
MSQMGEQEPHPADKAIGDHYREPGHARMMQAWGKLDPQTRERFRRLQTEHGWTAKPRVDRIPGEPQESAWIEYELVPPKGGEGEPERIDRWPVKVELDENNRVKAIREEHGV